MYWLKLLYSICKFQTSQWGARNFAAIAGCSWVLTVQGPRQVQDLEDTPCTLVVDGKTVDIKGFKKAEFRNMVQVITYQGWNIICTDDVKVISYNYNHKWDKVLTFIRELQPRVQDHSKQNKSNKFDILQRGSQFYIGDNVEFNQQIQNDQDKYDQGQLVGWVTGDGSYRNNRGQVVFFEKDLDYEAKVLAWKIYNNIHRLETTNYFQSRIPVGPRYYSYSGGGYYNIQSLKIARLCHELITSGNKCILPALEKENFSFLRGFIQSFFAADGCVRRTKYFYVSLSNTNYENLIAVQRILQRYGIISTTIKIRNAGASLFQKKKPCNFKTLYQLGIYGKSQTIFNRLFSFGCTRKQQTLTKLLENKQSDFKTYRTHFVAEFKEKVEKRELVGYVLLGENRFIEVNGILLQMDVEQF